MASEKDATSRSSVFTGLWPDLMPGDHFTILQKVGALHVLDHLGVDCAVVGGHSS